MWFLCCFLRYALCGLEDLARHCGVSKGNMVVPAVVCWHTHVDSTRMGTLPRNSFPGQEKGIISQFS